MESAGGDDTNSRRNNKLAAVSVLDSWKETEKASGETTAPFPDAWLIPVLSASLLIIGNTVGAGMLVLPELAEGPGMGISTSIFLASFLVNLVSGLIIAEVAINQHANSGNDVPSSFKDFAQVNLNSKSAATFISFISIFVNGLVMAFNTVKIGDMGADAFQGALSSDTVSLAWVASCTALIGTLSFSSLSRVTSLLVTGLFLSFAGILLPGLAHVTQDPFTLLFSPGISSNAMSSAGELVPVILMSLVYQNIVPTVTKMNDYNRTTTALSIALGSFIPLLMYLAWTFAVLGGGINNSAGLEGPLISMFFLTTIAGSSIGCIMSLAEEIESFLQPSGNDSNHASTDNDKFSFLSVAVSVCISWIGAMYFESDLNDALKIAGAYGSPLLYGVLPVVMAFIQRQQSKQREQQQLPLAALTTLGVASTGFMGNAIAQSVGDAIGMLTN
ncbi:MAG: hypothetical protein SGBAC_004707 [Bacillariaceae sp.]